MSVRLLDVNLLISIFDTAHIHHKVATQWFRSVAVAEGWATCPITQNGFVRILSQPGYPNLRLTPAQAAASLSQLMKSFSRCHAFWEDRISLIDSELFDLSLLTGARQTTDVYLAGLAFSLGGRVATLDRSVFWQAVRGANAGLIDKIE